MNEIKRRGFLLGSTAALALAGCSNGKSSQPEETGPVSIVAAGSGPGAPKEEIELGKQRVAEFEKANPNIKVELKEWVWAAETFGPQLAGGTLPTVFWIPFTEAQGLISRRQGANIQNVVSKEDWYSRINKNLWQVAQDKDGNTFGCPFSGYGMALHINRSIFAKAGLDPDKSFATWKEFQEAAKTITEKTGKQGFAIMSQKNQGGWELTTLAYAMGYRAQKVDGENVEATLTNDGYKRALGMLKDMRWTDKSLGTNALYEATPLMEDFQAGKLGMFMHVAGVWKPGFMKTGNQDDYGMFPLPVEGPEPGLLTGGNMSFVNAKATPAQQGAAVKWIAFNNYEPMLNEETAVSTAKSNAASKLAVGVPQLPVFDEATAKQYEEWIKPHANAPLEHMKPYTDKIATLPLTAEPTVKAQELYASLDDAVQAVQSDKNSDVGKLLQSAQDDFSSKVG